MTSTRTRKPLLVWFVVSALGLIAGASIIGSLPSDMDPARSSESMRTEAMIRKLTGVSTSILIRIPFASDEVADARIADLKRELLQLPAVLSVITTGTGPSSTALRSLDGRSTAVVIAIRAEANDNEIDEIVTESREVSVKMFGPQVILAGPAVVDEALGSAAERDLLRADAIAIPIVLGLLALALRTRQVCWWGLVSIVATICGSLLFLIAASFITDVSVFAVNVVTMFAVGLTVDYTLLVATEFQRQLQSHQPQSLQPEAHQTQTHEAHEAHEAHAVSIMDAVGRARSTAGRTVTYSGLTIAAALAGLLVFREPVLRSLGLGGIGATLTAVAVANTLLPALLRRSRPKDPVVMPDQHGGVQFRRLARAVIKRPAVAIAASLIGLAILASPALNLKSSGLDIRALPAENSARKAAETVTHDFPALALPSTEILIESQQTDKRVDGLIEALRSRSDIVKVHSNVVGDNQTLVSVRAPTNVHIDLASSLRRERGSLRYGVTGEAAEDADFSTSLVERLPVAIGVMALLTMTLLWLLTGSVLVPVKALLVSAVSLGASIGVLVWAFQDGHLAPVLGFTPVGGLDPVIVVLACIFAFGLSTDYEVFLLSSIEREHRDGATTNEAIEHGVGRTGRIITVAAGLMIVVFIGFASGDLIIIKQLGVALAAAILIDATIVRLVLVPAMLALFGEWNWWQPELLRRLRQRITSVESRLEASVDRG